MTTDVVTLHGLFYDGRRPIGAPATLIVRKWEAGLLSAHRSQSYAIEHLLVSARIGGADRFVALPDGGQFQCRDHRVLDALPQDSTAEGVVAWLETRVAVAVAAIAILVALVVLGYFYGLPAAAERVVRHIPMETEKVLGEEVMNWLDENDWFAPSRIDEDLLSFIEQDFEELGHGLPLATHHRLVFRRSDFVGANAFALPGGTIVITDAMVEAAESLDEIAAVLAHEIGHVEGRHALRHLIQNSVIAVLVAAITADAASLSVAVAGVPVLLAQAKYSREFETEADDFAFARLKQTGRSPEAFASLIGRLFQDSEEYERQYSFVSTHPVTAERVRRARAAARE